MCAAMNSEDEIETMLQEKKELEDLVNSQEMKDLDELLESIEDRDHYYSEIFDTLMYELVTCWSVGFNDVFRTVWKQRELEGEELQRGNNRTRCVCLVTQKTQICGQNIATGERSQAITPLTILAS